MAASATGHRGLGDLGGLRLSTADALFLDFDGTLTELRERPEDVHLTGPTRRRLLDLENRLAGALAIISGRDVRDLAARVPAALWRIGGHGLEICAPGSEPSPAAAQPPHRLFEPMRAAAQAATGVRLETKGPILALHFRQAPDAEQMCLDAAHKAARSVQGFVVQQGKCVVEVRPVEAEKGTALRTLMQSAPFAGRRPLMIGDDTTDESAFEAALKMGGHAVKVGEGTSVAHYRVSGPLMVRAWIEREARQ